MATLLLRRTVSSSLFAAASSSRLLTTAVAKPSARKDQLPLEPIKSPAEFMKAIAKPRRGDLSSITTLLGEDASWTTLHDLDRIKLKKAGVTIQERRYFLWAKERFKQGEHPDTFSIDVKPQKEVRGWGPRVQKGIRVRGRRRPGEK